MTREIELSEDVKRVMENLRLKGPCFSRGRERLDDYDLGLAGFGAGFGGITIPESPRTAIARQAPIFASALLLAESTAESHTSCTQYLADLNRSILEDTDFRYARSSSRTTLSVLGIPVLSYSTTVKTYRR